MGLGGPSGPPPGPPGGGPPGMGGPPPGMGGPPPEGGGAAPNKVQKVKAKDVWSALERSLKTKKDGQENGKKI